MVLLGGINFVLVLLWLHYMHRVVASGANVVRDGLPRGRLGLQAGHLPIPRH